MALQKKKERCKRKHCPVLCAASKLTSYLHLSPASGRTSQCPPKQKDLMFSSGWKVALNYIAVSRECLKSKITLLWILSESSYSHSEILHALGIFVEFFSKLLLLSVYSLLSFSCLSFFSLIFFKITTTFQGLWKDIEEQTPKFSFEWEWILKNFMSWNKTLLIAE